MSKRDDKRLQQVSSLKAREKFLDTKIFKTKLKEYSQDKDLLIALSSQGGWASYVRDGFLSMSLNTFKSVAEKSLYDGFSGIDEKRKIALSLLQEHLRSNDKKPREERSDTKKGLQGNKRNLEQQLSMMREANLILTRGLEVTIDALEKLEKISEEQGTKDVVVKEMSKIKSLLKRSVLLTRTNSTPD